MPAPGFEECPEKLNARTRFFVGWAKAAALPTKECGFTATVGKMEPLPTLHGNSTRLHFSLKY
jgi:hypothetical protein